MIQEFTQAIITMLAVINPAISGMIHVELTKGESTKKKIKEATRSSLQILLILIVVAFMGKRILNTFGISVESFRIVGGIVIAYIGFTMLTGKMSAETKKKKSKTKDGKIDNSPLVMFSASPGTIATLVTLSIGNGQGHIPFIALVAVGASMAITWITLALMSILPRKESTRHVFTSQFMGLILIAMGMQFALEGFKTFMSL